MKSILQFSALLFLVLNPNLIWGQKLSAQLGGVTTHFSFFSDQQKFDILEQGVYRRLVPVYELVSYYKVDQYFLQILTKNPVRTKDAIDVSQTNGSSYIVKFFSEDGNLLEALSFKEKPKQFNGYYVYEISLKDVPLILLDHTETIDITYYNIRHGKEYE